MEQIGKALPFVFSLAGTGLKAFGEASSGTAAREDAGFLAAQLRQKAGQERASASISALEAGRQGRLKGSRALAIAAASGAGASDPTVTDILTDISGDARLRALTALFEGEEAARGLETQADAAIRTGEAQQTASRYKAVATVLTGADTLYSRFGATVDDDDDTISTTSSITSGALRRIEAGGTRFG